MEPKQQDNYISLYTGKLTIETAGRQLVRLRKAFPQLPPEFGDILLDRIKEKGKGDEWLKDAINNLIDNFKYPVPTIANILDWDKRVKLLTYGDMLAIHERTGRAFIDHSSVTRGGRKYWVSNVEKELHNIQDEL